MNRCLGGRLLARGLEDGGGHGLPCLTVSRMHAARAVAL